MAAMAAEAAAAVAAASTPSPCLRSTSATPAMLRSSFLPQLPPRGHRPGARPCADPWKRVRAVAAAEAVESLVRGAAAIGTVGWGIVPAVLWYATAKPGGMSGVLDFVSQPMHSRKQAVFSAEEVELGRQLGEGSFGVVYEGYVGRKEGNGNGEKERIHVVLKKVKAKVEGACEVHDAEMHMNQRVKRTAPKACAEYLGAVHVSADQVKGRLTEGLWLVWRYQGDRTLQHYMRQRNFPENVAEAVLGAEAVEGRGFSREEVVEFESAVVRKVMSQILTSLRELHSSGVVHRDVKPLNLVLDQKKGVFTLIDLGACVDLRSGYNYHPRESIIDPVYAAPEQYVMPTTTPQLPPDPLCSLISPVLWLLNTPDRFDLYSTGLVFLQLCLKPLRSEMGLQAFNMELKRADYDLDVWREQARIHKDDFAILDADNGAGWELAKSLLQETRFEDELVWPSLGDDSRPSASAALRHRFLKRPMIQFSFPRAPAHVLPNWESILPHPAEAKRQEQGVPVYAAEGMLASGKMHGGHVHSRGAEISNQRGSEDPWGAVFAAARLGKTVPVTVVQAEAEEPAAGSSSGQGPNLFAGAVWPWSAASHRRLFADEDLAMDGAAEASHSGIAQAPFSFAKDSNTKKHSVEQSASSQGRQKDLFAGLVWPWNGTPQESFLASEDGPVSSASGVSGSSSAHVPVPGSGKLWAGARTTAVPAVDLEGTSQTVLATYSNIEDTNKGADEKAAAHSARGQFGPAGRSLASLPFAAVGAAGVVAGWLMLTAFKSSSAFTFDIGRETTDAVGMSGSAFVAFFLFVKPWLEGMMKAERKAKLRKRKASVTAAVVADSKTIQEIMARSRQNTGSHSAGLVEAIQAMDQQMASLEESIVAERKYALGQMQVLSKVKSLLNARPQTLTSSAENFQPDDERLRKPFTEYVKSAGVTGCADL